MERLFDRPLLKVAQPVRINEIIRVCARADLPILMVDPEKHDELEGLFEIIGILAYDGMFIAERLESFQRRRFPYPLLKREKPHDIHERRYSLHLEVQLVLVHAVIFNNKRLEKNDGRRILDRHVREVPEKDLLVFQE